jgi:hypothetical protein
VDGQRTKPNGSILRWKQLGVLEILNDSQQPFYVEWLGTDHPSSDGSPYAELKEIHIVGEENSGLKLLNKFEKFKLEDLKINFLKPINDITGIKEIVFEIKGNQVRID